MTMPPIADVKSAATYVSERSCSEAFWRDETQMLARFALAVLDAPGMSAERLAQMEIFSRMPSENAAHYTWQGWLQECVAELLRLRAACAAVVADYDAALDAGYDEEKWEAFDGVDLLRGPTAKEAT